MHLLHGTWDSACIDLNQVVQDFVVRLRFPEIGASVITVNMSDSLRVNSHDGSALKRVYTDLCLQAPSHCLCKHG